MVTRYIYIAKTDEVGVEKKQVAFDWYPGFSVAQKQKSIRSLHENARKMGYDNLLEISSKSPDDIGVKLSAFSLKLKGKSGLYIFMDILSPNIVGKAEMLAIRDISSTLKLSLPS